MHTVLSCSRVVVRALVTGVYNAAPLDSSDPPTPSSNPTTSAKIARVCSYSTTAKASPDSSGKAQSKFPKKGFVAAQCGFPKDLLGGSSTVLNQDSYGDDACFVATHSTADVVGVADGVGGWRDHGIDPSSFAKSLMHSCAALVENGEFHPHLPAQLIASAYQTLTHYRSMTSQSETTESSVENSILASDISMTSSLSSTSDFIRNILTENGKRKPLIGSSTACVVVLDKENGRLHTANLGDSGFLVLRDGKVVHQSEEQCHYFNCPFQIALPPEEYQNFISDSPESADTSSFEVREGDVILVATDGLFDNLPNHLIENEFAGIEKMDLARLQSACNSLALQARRLAFDPEFVSPFAKKANSVGINVMGGKPDDITVLLALVAKQEEQKGVNASKEAVNSPTLKSESSKATRKAARKAKRDADRMCAEVDLTEVDQLADYCGRSLLLR